MFQLRFKTISFTAAFVLLQLLFASGTGFTAKASETSCRKIYSVPAAHSSVAIPPRLLRYMTELPDRSPISDTVYQEFQLNDIARAVVNRVRTQEIKAKAELARTDIYKPVNMDENVDIILFFWSHDQKSIEKNGFQNQHQSGKSKGTYDPATRRKAEDTFTGIELGRSARAIQLRPKSAFLNIREKVTLATKNHRIMHQYGHIGAVLKPEIRDRALWTASDSLHLGTGYLTWSDYSGSGLIPARGTFYRDRLPCYSGCTNYYEALIYGQFDFHDVDYFVVKTPDLAASLKPLDKPIYLVKETSQHGRIVFEKGELLFEPKVTRLELPVPKPIALASEKLSTVRERLTAETTMEKSMTDSFTEILRTSGIEESVTAFRKSRMSTEELAVTRVKTADRDYFLYSPASTSEAFAEASAHVRKGLKFLESEGFQTRRILFSSDKLLIQEGRGRHTELTDIPELDRTQVAIALKNLIQELVEKQIYIKGLRPSMLLLDSNGNIIFKGLDGLREKDSAYDTAKRFEEKLLPHWQKYFESEQMDELKFFLLDLKNRYREEKAS